MDVFDAPGTLARVDKFFGGGLSIGFQADPAFLCAGGLWFSSGSNSFNGEFVGLGVVEVSIADVFLFQTPHEI